MRTPFHVVVIRIAETIVSFRARGWRILPSSTLRLCPTNPLARGSIPENHHPTGCFVKQRELGLAAVALIYGGDLQIYP